MFKLLNKKKSKSKSFKHYAKATLAQGVQIQLKNFVSAMRLKRRLGYETQGRRAC